MSALANPQDTNDPVEVTALEQIVDLARDGLIRLQVTTAYERDFARWNNPEGRDARLAWLSSAPPLPRASGVFRLDVSALDGGDVFASEVEVELDRQLRAVLRPSLTARPAPPYEEAPGVAMKAFSDIDHFVAHWRSGANAFVTLDTKTILKRRQALGQLSITACKPHEALAFLPEA